MTTNREPVIMESKAEQKEVASPPRASVVRQEPIRDGQSRGFPLVLFACEVDLEPGLYNRTRPVIAPRSPGPVTHYPPPHPP